MDKLHPFQEEVVQHLSPRKRGGLAIDMGLGKTCIALTIGARARLQRWLIICPDNAFGVWRDEAPRWIKAAWPEAHVTVIFVNDSGPWNRDLTWAQAYKQWDNPTHHGVIIYICTPNCFIRDWGTTVRIPGKKKKVIRFRPRTDFITPQIVIFDEAKRMRNPDSISFNVVSKFLRYYHIEYFFPMTGTPGHGPKDFWTMLHCIDHKAFPSYWQFLYKYHEVIDGFWGKEVGEPKSTNLDSWHKILGQYFSVIKETDEGIADQRPPITRQLLSISMDFDQQQLYDSLTKELMFLVEADDNLVIAQNSLSLMTKLRQVLICPRILSPSLGIGAAIKDFTETVETDQHVVIFTPFTQAIPHFTSYLESKSFRVFSLQGGMETTKRDATIRLYREKPSVLICSTMYAQAFSLEPATRSFSIGYSYDPDDNRQAEKRLHRLTTQSPITSYYYTARSTFDERACDILNIKQRNVNLTIPENLRALLKGESLI